MSGFRYSLPELVDFKLFGKTILVVNTKFKLFLASQLGKRGYHLLTGLMSARFMVGDVILTKFYSHSPRFVMFLAKLLAVEVVVGNWASDSSGQRRRIDGSYRCFLIQAPYLSFPLSGGLEPGGLVVFRGAGPQFAPIQKSNLLR